jgi:hypothetical protein
MKNMDKELTVPKWVLINQPKIPQIPQNVFAQIVSPSSKGFIGRPLFVSSTIVLFFPGGEYMAAVWWI